MLIEMLLLLCVSLFYEDEIGVSTTPSLRVTTCDLYAVSTVIAILVSDIAPISLPIPRFLPLLPYITSLPCFFP